MLITSSCPTVGSVLLVTNSMIWSVPLNVFWKGMSAMLFHLYLWRHPLIHPICKVPFTYCLSYFLGKWKSKTVVLVISSILKGKKIPNSKCLAIFKVTQTVQKSVLCHFSQPGMLVPWPGIESAAPAVEMWHLYPWTTREVLIQTVSWGFCSWWANLGNHVNNRIISWWKERPKDVLRTLNS